MKTTHAGTLDWKVAVMGATLGIFAWGCTVTSSGNEGTGGTNGSGGAASSGGSSGGGGSTNSGGQTGSGGSSVTSGGSGGKSDSGGATGSGGLTVSGGETGNGGQPSSGGVTGVGGLSAAGGRSNAGGVTGPADASAGGAMGPDAAIGSGGSTGRGGATSTGGALSTGGVTATGGTTGAAGSTGSLKGPCDIYKEIDGQPCVAAHSTVRLLLSTYTGPLYQVRKGGSASGTGGATTDIGFTADGYADGAAQDTACGTSACTISKIYDQSGKGNHLTVAPAGGAKTTPDNEADAKARPITLNGHKVYGEDGKVGVGYRNNKAVGTATGDNAETMYAIFDATVFNGGCCYDYGNMETNSRDNGEGTMEAIYWGNCTIWGRGAGSGPWVMGDLENGLWAGNVSPYSGNTSITGMKYVTAVLKGDAAGKNHWAIKAGNAQSGNLTKMFDGVRPSSKYNPMRKEGAIGLNTGGDNSNGAIGVFFEGIMTAHYASDAADDAVQANIVAAGYGK